jgi:hypothetical protein
MMRYLQRLCFILFILLINTSNGAAQRKVTAKPKLLSHQEVFAQKMLMPIPPSVTEGILQFGKSFLGNAYPKSNIDTTRRSNGAVKLQPIGKEVLVVNLRLFDCVTFVENMVALTQTRRHQTPNFEVFKQYLKNIRYRDGAVDYAARLHYFSDWLFENEKRGILKIITKDIGGEFFNKNVFYMSFKKDTLYGNMADPATFAAVRQIEDRITQREKWYIPKDRVAAMEHLLKDGDIIGITNRTEGMDMAHAGIVIRRNGRVHMIHASSKYRQVLVTDVPLTDYLMQNKLQTGIMVGRLL